MKKLFMLLMAALLLAACGDKVHENIRQELAADTEQVISIFDKTIEEDRELTEREEKIFQEYQVKYGAIKNNPDLTSDKLTDEENRLFILTSDMIDMYDYYTTLKSDHEKYERTRDRLRKVIETGKI